MRDLRGDFISVDLGVPWLGDRLSELFDGCEDIRQQKGKIILLSFPPVPKHQGEKGIWDDYCAQLKIVADACRSSS